MSFKKRKTLACMQTSMRAQFLLQEIMKMPFLSYDLDFHIFVADEINLAADANFRSWIKEEVAKIPEEEMKQDIAIGGRLSQLLATVE